MSSIFNGLTTLTGSPGGILNAGLALSVSGPYRPPQWARPQLATFAMTVPTPAENPTANVGDGGNSVNPADATTIYVFDGMMRGDHTQEVIATKNPIQTGAPITDHAYRTPARLVVDLIMSDAMQGFTTGQFSSSTSRSVSAYQTLLAVQQSLTLVQLSTRFRPYYNMLIVDLRAEETAETRYAGKFSVTFEEIITAGFTQSNQNLSGASTSLLPQTTDTTTAGQTLVTAVSTAIKIQHAVSSIIPGIPGPLAIVAAASVPGAGRWSSTNVNPTNQPASQTAQVLPLTPSPNQTLSAALSIDNGTTKLSMKLNYSTVGGYWLMNIFDQTGAAIVSSVPLLTGAYPAANILAPYQYLGVGSAYVINVSGTTAQDYPNASDLGSDFAVLWDSTLAS